MGWSFRLFQTGFLYTNLQINFWIIFFLQYHFIFSALEGDSILEMQHIMCEVIGRMFFPQSVRGLLTVDSHTHKDPTYSRVLTRLRGFFSTLSGMWTIDQIGWWFTSHVKKCAGKNSRYNDKKPISDSPNYLDGIGYVNF